MYSSSRFEPKPTRQPKLREPHVHLWDLSPVDSKTGQSYYATHCGSTHLRSGPPESGGHCAASGERNERKSGAKSIAQHEANFVRHIYVRGGRSLVRFSSAGHWDAVDIAGNTESRFQCLCTCAVDDSTE